MVRRWSYLNIKATNSHFDGVAKAHRFKIFRKSTKFKKFNRGLIDFVRRKNIKRKKYINYITLSYLSSDWSKNYLNQRSILRFSQALNMHNYSLDSLQPNILIKLSKKFTFTNGFHAASTPSKRALSTINSLKLFNIYLQNTNFSRNTITSLNTFDSNTDNLNSLGLSTYTDLNSKFYLLTSIKNSATNLNPLNLNNRVVFNMIKSYRSIIVLLLLLSIN